MTKQMLSCVLLVGLLVLVSGCSAESRAAPVDVSLARATLEKVLKHWKDGGHIDDFRQQSPEIVVQEELWFSGRPLVDYRITEDGRAENANWFCDVELVIGGKSGGDPQTKIVTYAVGTDPVLTVFHAML